MSENTARPIRLLRAFATVGGWTMGSRVLGFIRDVMIAGLLGAGPMAEAFFVAFRLPNMFRRLFAEGAFNMAFIPLFAKRLELGEDAKGFAEEAMAGLLSVLLVLTALAMIFMPFLVLALAAGFSDDPDRLSLAVLYSRIQFPYLTCMALTALFSGILNALGRFAAPAAAPVLLNVILISAMTIAAVTAAPVGTALAIGVLLAGFAQVAMVARAASLAGMKLKLRRPRWTPAMKRLVTLGVPGAISGGIMQINLLIGTVIASFFPGAVAWLSYSDRLYQLPLGVVGVAIGVVLLPELSRRVRAKDEAGARAALSRATEFSMALTLPAAVALAITAGPLASVLFARGAFTEADAAAVALAVSFYALGLPAFVMQKVTQPTYYAREDTKSPLRFAMISIAVDITLALIGTQIIGWSAIPLATAIAAWVNLTLLWRGARAFGESTSPDARLLHRLPRLLIASLGMGVGLWFGKEFLAEALMTPGLRYPALIGLVAFGGALYAALALALGGASLKDLRSAVRRG